MLNKNGYGVLYFGVKDNGEVVGQQMSDTKRKGREAKASITPAIGELIQIASEKAQYPDYNNKHGAKAQFWMVSL